MEGVSERTDGYFHIPCIPLKEDLVKTEDPVSINVVRQDS